MTRTQIMLRDVVVADGGIVVGCVALRFDERGARLVAVGPHGEWIQEGLSVGLAPMPAMGESPKRTSCSP